MKYQKPRVIGGYKDESIHTAFIYYRAALYDFFVCALMCYPSNDNGDLR